MGICASTNNNESKFMYLSNTPLTLHFSEDELLRFAEIFTIVSYTKADIRVFREGDEGDRWFIVGDGTIRMSIRSEDKKTKKFLCYKQAGDFFGESAVLNEYEKEPAIRTASATTNSEAKLLVVTRSTLFRFLYRNPGMKVRLMSIIQLRMEHYLAKIGFLSQASAPELRLLGSMLHYVPLKKGKVLFEEGSIGKSLFLVYQGSVNATTVKNGETIVLNSITEGMFFGEIGLMVDMPRTATIVGVEDCLLLELRKDDLHHFLLISPPTATHFDKVMKQRVSENFRKYNVPFFAAIPDDKYAMLAELCLIEEHPKGDVIFSEGDAGNSFYIIAHGEVLVKVNKQGKDDVVVRTMGAGQYFGEIALVRETARTDTVITKSKCVMLSISKANFEKFIVTMPQAMADFQVKLARYEAELKPIIYHPVALEYFRRHLKMEYSVENLQFWEAAQRFMIKDENQDVGLLQMSLQQEAEAIAEYYLDPSTASEEINIAGPLKDACLKRIANGDVDRELFVQCAAAVFKLMERDSFKRFKQSPLFQEFLAESDNDEQRAVDKKALT